MKTYSRLILAFLLLILAVPQVGADEASENGKEATAWSDQSGKFRIKATLIDIIDGNLVVLKRESDGKVIKVPLSRLSAKSKAKAMQLHGMASGSKTVAPDGTDDKPTVVQFLRDTISINDVRLSKPPTISELTKALGKARYFPKKDISEIARRKKAESDRLHGRLWESQFLVWDDHGIVAKLRKSYDRRDREDRIETILFCYQKTFTKKQMQCFPKKDKFKGEIKTSWGDLNGSTPDPRFQEYLIEGGDGLDIRLKNDFYTLWQGYHEPSLTMIAVQPNPFDQKKTLMTVEIGGEFFTSMLRGWLDDQMKKD